ncbi:MAG: MBL fold metallo-hydrolase [Chloroflexi bacterium]|nr:MBL fold metallo-hydrolase [Chloroflexota bacterium]
MRVQFLGSGDTFGSGGRFQTCILLEAGAGRYLVDCGASSLIALRRFGVEPNTIDAVLLTHLHGDHFGGIPFLVLDAQLVSKRERPLLVAGPPGTPERIRQAMEVLFPGSWAARRRFALELRELEPGRAQPVGALKVTPYVVEHPSGAPALALRIACGGKTVAYTGDTAWTDALIAASQGADLLIAEAYSYEKQVPFHLDLQTLLAHLDELRPNRLIVTHMSADMLARLATLPCEYAEDGEVVEI